MEKKRKGGERNLLDSGFSHVRGMRMSRICGRNLKEVWGGNWLWVEDENLGT